MFCFSNFCSIMILGDDMMVKKRLIFHVDVNNAFLSWTAVDLIRRGNKQDIRKIPSIIGGDEKARHGIVLAKSPVAKKYGVITAETIYSARKKCPNLKVFPPDYNLYKRQSNLLYRYLSNYTPVIEQYSVDECFLDMTGTSLLYKEPLELAYKIKDDIKNLYGFTVNVGIGNNKLCAKMASDFEKPDKVHTLFNEEIEKKLWPLPVEDLFMVGRKSTPLLKQLNINTIGDLAKTDLYLLKKYFKSQGILMKEYANGVDNSELETNRNKNKCISVSRTFPKDIEDEEELKKILFSQADEVSSELRRQHQYAKTVAVTYKNSEFITYSHQMKLYNQTNVTTEIYKAVENLFDRSWKGDSIRNIGIRLSDLVTVKEKQLSLFETEVESNNDKIQEVLDKINDKYGRKSIVTANSLENLNNKKDTE